MIEIRSRFLLLLPILIHMTAVVRSQTVPARGTVVTEKLNSTFLRDTRTGLDPVRSIKVYLPPGYARSEKRYPVIYYCHSINWSADRMFQDGNLVKLMERAFASGVSREFIFVAADYSSPTMGSWFENSSTSGHWVDFTVKELVPFIDARFRTIGHRDSRGVAGDFVGGYGALKFAMFYPELFGVVYALHPVATGVGVRPMASVPNWSMIHGARSYDDLTDGYSRSYVAIAQAFLPNASRPPFYCDFMVEKENGVERYDVENAKKLREGFLLDHMPQMENLRKLRAVAFDWARYDPGYSHVHSVREFSIKLDELGIDHGAEEYRGDPWSRNFTENGRFYSRLLPFFGEYLVFEGKN